MIVCPILGQEYLKVLSHKVSTRKNIGSHKLLERSKNEGISLLASDSKSYKWYNLEELYK